MPFAAPFAVALAAALVLTPLAIRIAWATGYLDHPEARKLHVAATPLLGGAAVFVAALAGWGTSRLLLPAVGPPQALQLLGGALIALLLGLWDDRHGMDPRLKLAGQATAAAVVLSIGFRLPFGFPPAVDFFLGLVALVGLMNAVNFLDNVNGMVAGLAAITFTAFAAHSISRGALGVGAAQLALAGGCAGFLRYNFPKAAIFLGDAGSLFLGYSLGASAVLASAHAPAGWAQLGPLLLLAYPAFDLIFVVVNRLREGRPIYVGGKDHSNHRLASVLQCPKRTVILVWCSTAALCASGLVVLWLNRPLPALLLSGLWMVLFLLSGLRLSSVPIAPSPSPRPQ